MKTKSGGRRSAARSPGATRTLSLVCLLALVTGSLAVLATGCATDVHYLRGNERTVHLMKGDPAPCDGWLLSDDQLAELYDLLERKILDEDSRED